MIKLINFKENKACAYSDVPITEVEVLNGIIKDNCVFPFGKIVPLLNENGNNVAMPKKLEKIIRIGNYILGADSDFKVYYLSLSALSAGFNYINFIELSGSVKFFTINHNGKEYAAASGENGEGLYLWASPEDKKYLPLVNVKDLCVCNGYTYGICESDTRLWYYSGTDIELWAINEKKYIEAAAIGKPTKLYSIDGEIIVIGNKGIASVYGERLRIIAQNYNNIIENSLSVYKDKIYFCADNKIYYTDGVNVFTVNEEFNKSVSALIVNEKGIFACDKAKIYYFGKSNAIIDVVNCEMLFDIGKIFCIKNGDNTLYELKTELNGDETVNVKIKTPLFSFGDIGTYAHMIRIGIICENSLNITLYKDKCAYDYTIESKNGICFLNVNLYGRLWQMEINGNISGQNFIGTIFIDMKKAE